MASNSSGDITQDHGSDVELVVMSLTISSMVATIALLVCRLRCKFVIPEAWKASLILQDAASLILGAGLVFLLVYVGSGVGPFCSAAGFFLLFGVLDWACMLALTAISLLFLQNPGKLGQLSTFKKSWILVLLVPEKIAVFLLSLMPVTPLSYFDTTSPYPVACFPLRQEGARGAAFGAILFFTLWLLQAAGLVLSGVCAFRLWRSSNIRIHASSPNLWQTEKIGQGRALQKMLLLEQLGLLGVTFTLTLVVHSNAASTLTPQWVVLMALTLMMTLHCGVTLVQLVLWSAVCCCRGDRRSKEPYQKLKKLELIKVEGPGKLRLAASWSGGRGVVRRGLLKVYGLNRVKGWAQEIVVLGMLRKERCPSLLQCLWTANTNPYFHTMTTLSGQIVTQEARLICLELTSSGNLADFLRQLEVPLPEPCTRCILHDLAEGLAALHAHNVLHANLTSAAVYLKGSVQRLVLRAALGDFEEARVYGSLQNGSSSLTSPSNKKLFFLPDIRAFALVALEVLAYVCKRRMEEKQPHRLVSTSSKASKGDGTKDASSQLRKLHKSSPSSSSGSQLMIADAPNSDLAKSSRVFVVETTTVDLPDRSGMMAGKKLGREKDRKVAALKEAPYPTASNYEDVEAAEEYGDDDSGMSVSGGYYPEKEEEEGETPGLPPITHVREAISYEFPNQSVFRAPGHQEDDYQEIDDIQEEIHREIRYNALNRRKMLQTGGYIVTRTTSGRELFLPANDQGPHPHPAQQHAHLHQLNASFANSDSGYVGTSTTSSLYPPGAREGAGASADDPADVTWPKAAHRTTSANTVSSFGGDDILEVLPGMADEDEQNPGDRSLRQMLRARHDAKLEQIMADYQLRVRQHNFSRSPQPWPKLKFSRAMGQPGGGAAGEGAKADSRPGTPRAAGPQEGSSPRPQTAAVSRKEAKTTQPLVKSRPLSAHASSMGTRQLRSSFVRNKARNELVRALSRGNSFAQSKQGKQGKQPMRAVHQRGISGKSVEEKYASHNRASSQNRVSKNDQLLNGGVGSDAVSGGERGFEMPAGCPSTPHRIQTPCSETEKERPLVNNQRGQVINILHSETGKEESFINNEAAELNYSLHSQHGKEGLSANEEKVPYIDEKSTVDVQMVEHSGPLNPSLIPKDGEKSQASKVGQFSSFSSCDSALSYGKPRHARDTSLTSGELSSLSSQADPCREPHTPQPSSAKGNKEALTEPPAAVVQGPGMKLIDSGFDEDSGSVASDISHDEAVQDVSGEVCTCSCGSETVSASCSCDCSQCQFSHSGSPRHSGWSESQSSCGTWSNSNSFSSYDVQMHRRKLPSKGSAKEHVLAPDEQYPSHPSSPTRLLKTQTPSPTCLSPPGRGGSHRSHRHHHHHHHHHRHHSHSSTSSKGSGSSAALRRYRELTKKGVPLRVSKVDGDCSQRQSGKHRSGEDAVTAEVIEEEEDVADTGLYQDLQSQGFFESTDSVSSKGRPVRHKKSASASKRLEKVQKGGTSKARGGETFNPYSHLPPIASLEDIIKEIPDETAGSISGDETKAFLNRPESEISVKALKPPAPKPPIDRPPYIAPHHTDPFHNDPEVLHEAERVIDRMFSHKEIAEDPGLGLDQSTLRQLGLLPSPARDLGEGEAEKLLALPPGTDSKHVLYVRRLSDRVGLVSSCELLPADPGQFQHLRRRLVQAGGFGSIGLQLLDIAGACWVKDTPPCTADIVDQLTDHMTETEL